MTTTALSDTQKSLLKVAAGCDDRAIRWPDTLRGGARTKIIAALVNAKLAENRKGTLVVTAAGMRAVGVEPKRASKPAKSARTEKAQGAPRTMRGGTKQARLIEMLKRARGATVEEIVAELDWQAHTVRGAMAGALKKRLGLKIKSEKVEGRGRVYRLAD